MIEMKLYFDDWHTSILTKAGSVIDGGKAPSLNGQQNFAPHCVLGIRPQLIFNTFII